MQDQLKHSIAQATATPWIPDCRCPSQSVKSDGSFKGIFCALRPTPWNSMSAAVGHVRRRSWIPVQLSLRAARRLQFTHASLVNDPSHDVHAAAVQSCCGQRLLRARDRLDSKARQAQRSPSGARCASRRQRRPRGRGPRQFGLRPLPRRRKHGDFRIRSVPGCDCIVMHDWHRVCDARLPPTAPLAARTPEMGCPRLIGEGGVSCPFVLLRSAFCET